MPSATVGISCATGVHILEILERKVGLEKVYTLYKAQMHDRCIDARLLASPTNIRHCELHSSYKQSNHFFLLINQNQFHRLVISIAF